MGTVKAEIIKNLSNHFHPLTGWTAGGRGLMWVMLLALCAGCSCGGLGLAGRALATSTLGEGADANDLQAGVARVWQADGMAGLFVPWGEFSMGSKSGDEDEKPQHTVSLDAFWIDQTEVTNAMFERFVKATGYESDAEKAGRGHVYNEVANHWEAAQGASWRQPQGAGSDISSRMEHPVVQVSWNDAAAYCAWAGRRLPSEAQWEKAARGTDGSTYPWGNRINCSRANYWGKDGGCVGGTSPVGSYPAGASPYGALDMAGNAWEWVSDWYAEDYYERSAQTNPTGPPTGELRVLRGGSWYYYRFFIRSAIRYEEAPAFSNSSFGFRCAQSYP